MSELDRAVGRIDAEIAQGAERAVGGAVNDRVERRVSAPGAFGEPGGVLRF